RAKSSRCRCGPMLLAYPSLKIRYSTCRTAGSRPARSCGEGRRNGTPEALMVCFARLILCAIVASGTRKALAISAVVKPPTARNALLRPLRESGDHSLLHGVFGRGEVAEAARDGAEHVRRKFTQQVLDRSVVLMACHLRLFPRRCSEAQIRMATQNGPHFDGYICRFSARARRL